MKFWCFFSDSKIEIIVKVEPENFPTKKAFQFKQNFHKKIGKSFIPKISTKVQWSANKNSFGSFEKDETTKHSGRFPTKSGINYYNFW